jgi:hypothetical protein
VLKLIAFIFVSVLRWRTPRYEFLINLLHYSGNFVMLQEPCIQDEGVA